MLSETRKPMPPYILIVDDEVHCVGTLRSMLEKKYGDQIARIESCNNVRDARESIRAKEPDLVFLDVEMPRESGFDLLKTYDSISFDVIFTTAHEHYAIKAIKFNALDYLLKPFSMQELDNSMSRFWEKRNSNSSTESANIDVFLHNLKLDSNSQRKIALPTMEGLIFVPLEEIIRCEASDNYTKFFFTNGSTQLICKTLKAIEYLVEDMNFIRVHHSQLINLQHVSSYVRGQGGFVKMMDGSQVEISRRKKAEFIKRTTGI